MDRGEISNYIGEQAKTREKCDPVMRVSERKALVMSFYQSEAYELVKNEIAEALKRKNQNGINSSNTQGSLSGRIFEQMALDYYYSKLSNNPENEALAKFLQQTLLDPDLRRIDYYVEGGMRSDFFDESKVTPNSPYDKDSADSKLVLSESKVAFANPDALLVDVQTDINNKKVAKIIGAIDAKVKGGIDAKQRDGFKQSLWRLVMKLRPHYSEIVKSLGVADELPEEIDIVDDMQKLGVKVIRPQLYPDSLYTQKNEDGNDIVIPITRSEISDIVASITNEIIGEKQIQKPNLNKEVTENKLGTAFVLKVNQKGIEKYDENGDAAKFVETWVNTPDAIEGIVFTKDESKLLGVELVLKRDEKISVPIHIFRKIFLDDNVLPAPQDNPVGIRLKSSDGLAKYIFPNTPKRLAKEGEDWKNIVKRISINGVFLGSNVSVAMK